MRVQGLGLYVGFKSKSQFSHSSRSKFSTILCVIIMCYLTSGQVAMSYFSYMNVCCQILYTPQEQYIIL